VSITLHNSSSVQWFTDADDNPTYPRQVVVDLGRPGMRYGIEMRDLIHWTAYRLDIGSEGSIVNHRAAVALRSIAEQYFPYIEDEADYIAEELEIELEDDVPAVTSAQRFNIRLLDLVDGMVFVGTSFSEMLWNDQTPHPLLAANAANTIDFEFLTAAFEHTGIRGIRVAVNDLINWLLASESCEELSFLEEESAIDELEIVQMRALAAINVFSAGRRRELIDAARSRGPVAAMPAPSVEEQDQILKELSALI
jgi:hypothetical protein